MVTPEHQAHPSHRTAPRSEHHERWLGVALGVVLVLLASLASAVTHLVPSEFATIQAGIDAAIHGDTVLVAPGTYTGAGNRDIRFNGKRIVLRSQSGAGATVIDCQGSAADPHRGFYFISTGETPESVVSGFTIQNGYTAGTDGDGSAIRIQNTSPTVRDCIITRCGGGNSSAVAIFNSNTTMSACSVVENNEGIAVYCGKMNRMEDCIIANNSGTGLYLEFGEVVRTTVAGNGRYGIHVQNCSLAQLTECLVYGNDDTGIFAFGTCDLRIERCSIAGNRPPGGEAAIRIHADNSDVIISRTIVWGNCADALKVSTTSDVTLECCAIDPLKVVGSGNIQYVGPGVTTDPLFCAPEDCTNAPTTEGDYSLQEGSPCLPENSPCGELIGALGQGCTPTSVPGTDDPTSAGITRDHLSLQISPNPASGVARLYLTGAAHAGATGWSPERSAVEVHIMDAAGRTHLRASRSVAPGGVIDLDTRLLPAGVYFVIVRAGLAMGTARLSVIR